MPARTPLADLGFTSMKQVLVLEPGSSQQLGTDLLLQMLLS